ncbi:MAG TPA: type II secretion system protein GspK [Candidatus Paceibacterota bacterium]|nr:type II secretion system protein GspK [Verrucomicrobiota bacterium]HSA09949.1 type II secretion system protein GspK [Candidatus Paceibacterota bacterium]
MKPSARIQSLAPALPFSGERGSVLVIVLWIAFGLVSLALYFSHSMNFELRASDNRVSAIAADQAIDGTVRYLTYLLDTYAADGSNGVYLNLDASLCEGVPVGDARYWLIGRDTNNPVGPGLLCFGLVDESSKINLNTASSNTISWLPRMTGDLTQAILDWRDTNGNGPTMTYYAMQQPSYQCKCDLFETVDELRLLYGGEMDTLLGEDANRNGVLDPSENDENQNGMLDAGVLDCVTVYSREPRTGSINIRSLGSASSQLVSLLQTNFGTTRANEIVANLGLGGGSPGGRPGGTVSFISPLRFYIQSKMTSTEFAQVATNLTTSSGSYIEGRVNVNTASAAVLACLLDGDIGVAEQLVNYRQSNPNNLTSIAWVVDALGDSAPEALAALEVGDYITTQSYQFTADIAAVGHHGRGYRRVKFVFDTSSGTPRILYRQDLTHLGWALGKDVRQQLLIAKGTG